MNQEKIVLAAIDYTKLLLEEYPEAADGGHAVVVTLPASMQSFVLTLTPTQLMPPTPEQQGGQAPSPWPDLPAPEEQLLHHPVNGDTEVSDEDDITKGI